MNNWNEPLDEIEWINYPYKWIEKEPFIIDSIDDVKI